MAIFCPHCESKIKSSMAEGKKSIRCPRCGEKFAVDSEDDEPQKKRPRDDADEGRNRKSRKGQPAGNKTLLLVGILGVGGMAMVGLIALIAVGWFWLSDRKSPRLAEGPKPDLVKKDEPVVLGVEPDRLVVIPRPLVETVGNDRAATRREDIAKPTKADALATNVHQDPLRTDEIFPPRRS